MGNDPLLLPSVAGVAGQTRLQEGAGGLANHLQSTVICSGKHVSARPIKDSATSPRLLTLTDKSLSLPSEDTGLRNIKSIITECECKNFKKEAYDKEIELTGRKKVHLGVTPSLK